MVDVILRVLVGFFIFAIGGWIAALLFGLLTGLVNGVAYFLARGVRRLFGINEGWTWGASLAAAGVALGKLAGGFCFFAGATFVALLTVWMPSVFLFGLFGPALGEV